MFVKAPGKIVNPARNSQFEKAQRIFILSGASWDSRTMRLYRDMKPVCVGAIGNTMEVKILSFSI